MYFMISLTTERMRNLNACVRENQNLFNKSEEIRERRCAILNFNRLSFLILSFLEQYDADNKVSAMSVRELASVEDIGYKENTIFKKVSELVVGGYAATGYKDGKSKTFFITEKGRILLREERGQ